MNLKEYSELDATAISALIDRGETSAEEIKACAIDAAENLNVALNFVSGEIDHEATLQSDGIFAGVPMLLKESHGCQGHPLMQGSLFGQGITSPQDSEFVRRIKKTGVTILGATTAPEFGIYPVTESRLHGATRNPWNLDHSPGGSSGGSSAAVAAGIVPVASSSDGGGSIRGPAHCTGIFGLKASRARNPSGAVDAGLFPFSHFHVSTRSVRDSAAFLDALHGPQPGSRYWVPAPTRPFVSKLGAPPGKLKIAISNRAPFEIPLAEECRIAVDKAAKLCESLGHEVDIVDPTIDWEQLERAFLPAYVYALPSTLKKLEQLFGRRADESTLERMTWRTLEYARSLTVDDLVFADQVFQIHRRSLDLFFQNYDVWITPGGISQAPRIGEFDPSLSDESAWDFSHRCLASFAAFTPLLNATGHPAASVPLHHGENDLPAGIQIITSLGDEATLLRLCSQLETASPWAARKPKLHASRISA